MGLWPPPKAQFAELHTLRGAWWLQTEERRRTAYCVGALCYCEPSDGRCLCAPNLAQEDCNGNFNCWKRLWRRLSVSTMRVWPGLISQEVADLGGFSVSVGLAPGVDFQRIRLMYSIGRELGGRTSGSLHFSLLLRRRNWQQRWRQRSGCGRPLEEPRKRKNGSTTAYISHEIYVQLIIRDPCGMGLRGFKHLSNPP